MYRISLKLLALAALGLAAGASLPGSAQPDAATPRFEVPAPASGGPLTFVVYGDTRFTEQAEVANPLARRALVDRIARDNPAAILIGGDLVYQGSKAEDYATYRTQTLAWSQQRIPVFPALGNHEFKGCDEDVNPCLENWWNAFSSLQLRSFRWYSVSIGPTLLALILDSDAPLRRGSEQRAWLERQIADADQRFKFILIVMHYPPVRDPIYPAVLDEREVARYLARKAASLRAAVVVVGSHVHNYERYRRNGVTYLVSGGGGAKPVPALRMFGEVSRLKTAVNFHYLRFTLERDRLDCTMVRFEANEHGGDPWTEPDRFEISAKN